MTLLDLKALTAYWRRRPPVHIAVSAYLGYGKGGGSSTAPASPNSGEGATAMEAVAALLGPPTEKFRPPARMLPTPTPES